MDYSLIAVRPPASWRVANKVEICQLFSEFAIRLRVTSNVDEYFAHRSKNVIDLSLFVYILWRASLLQRHLAANLPSRPEILRS